MERGPLCSDGRRDDGRGYSVVCGGAADSRNRDDGDVEAALPADAFAAEYSVPYLAHATMEPMMAGAWLGRGRRIRSMTRTGPWRWRGCGGR